MRDAIKALSLDHGNPTHISIKKAPDKAYTRNYCQYHTIEKKFPKFLNNRNGKKLDTFSGDKSETGLKEYITRWE